MNGMDAGVIVIILVSLLIGVWRGLLYEVLSLLGWPIAFVLSKMFAGSIATLLPITQEVVRITAAYALVFIFSLIVWGILVRMTSKMLKSLGVAWSDKVMGGVFGVLRGGLVVLVLAWLAGMTRVPEQPFWRGSLTGKTLEDVALLTKGWLPDNISQRVHYRARS